MNRRRRTRDEIRAMLTTQFGWSGFRMSFGLDGNITQMQ
jgi:hypothetical protein